MNSRLRRKQAAREHNDRIALMFDLRQVQDAIHAKHGAWVQVVIDDSNDSLRREIAKLRGIFEADAPPPRPVAVGGGAGRLRARQKLAIVAAMASLSTSA